MFLLFRISSNRYSWNPQNIKIICSQFLKPVPWHCRSDRVVLLEGQEDAEGKVLGSQGRQLNFWAAAWHCPPPTPFQQHNASQRRRCRTAERYCASPTTQATTHGPATTRPMAASGLMTWPDSLGFPLSGGEPCQQPGRLALHIFQVNLGNSFLNERFKNTKSWFKVVIMSCSKYDLSLSPLKQENVFLSASKQAWL